MPPKPSWRERLYLCQRTQFPLFARLRLIYEGLRIKKNEFGQLIEFMPGKSEQSLKNILDGKVLDSPYAQKGWSRLDSTIPETAVNALRRKGWQIVLGDLIDPMSEKEFAQRLATVMVSTVGKS